MTPEELERLAMAQAAQEASLGGGQQGLLSQMSSGLSRFGDSSVGQGLLSGGQFLADTALSAISKPYAEDLMARNRMEREEELRQQGQRFNAGVLGESPQLKPFDPITQELTGITDPQEFAGHGFLGGDMTDLEYMSQMQSSPNPAMRTAAAAAIRDQMQPQKAAGHGLTNVVRGAQGNAFGIDPTGQQIQLPGAVVPQAEKNPLVQILNGPQANLNLADKEMFKVTGKYRGDRLSRFHNRLSQDQNIIDSMEETSIMLGSLAGETDWTNVGFAALMKDVPAFPSMTWAEKKQTIVSRLALGKMMELKAASPTGATGFGALSERELNVLETELGSLKQAQNEKDIKIQIKKIQRLLATSVRKTKKRRSDEGAWYNRNLTGTRLEPWEPTNSNSMLDLGDNPDKSFDTGAQGGESDDARFKRLEAMGF